MRTKNSFLNFITSFFPWLLIAILGFVKIKFFINFFGSELNGLIQLIGQVYSYIGILEMGFGAAIVYKLYKPFKENDTETIKRIFKGSKKIYRSIAILMFIFGLSAALISIFVLKAETLSKPYIFIIFLLYAIDYLSLYFFGLPHQTLLTADQKKYKVNVITNIKSIIFRIIELILIFTRINYIYILILSIIFNFIGNLILIRTVNKEYPWINDDCEADTSTRKMTKSVFFHRICKTVYYNTDMILLSLFPSGLVSASIYGSYNYIVTYLKQLLNMVLVSPVDSFGNLYSDDKIAQKKKTSIFNEYLSLSMVMGLFASVMFFIAINEFIPIWINTDYVLSIWAVSFFSMIIWYEYSLKPINIIIEANGEYEKTKFIPLAGAILNIVLSICLVFNYGISGVLFATLITQVLIFQPLYVKFAYKNIINDSSKEFYKRFLFSTILGVLLILLDYGIIECLNLYNYKSYLCWFYSSAIIGIIDLGIIFGLFYFLSPSFKAFLKRIKGVRKKK